MYVYVLTHTPQVLGPNNPSDPGDEATLDIEYIMGVAPGVPTWCVSLEMCACVWCGAYFCGGGGVVRYLCVRLFMLACVRHAVLTQCCCRFVYTSGRDGSQEPFLEWIVATNANDSSPLVFSVRYGGYRECMCMYVTVCCFLCVHNRSVFPVCPVPLSFVFTPF